MSAIASTPDTHAWDNTSTHPGVATGFPIYRLDGAQIAASNRDLWDGSIGVPINITEAGASMGESLVWTGTDYFGSTDGEGGLGFTSPDFFTTHLLGLTTSTGFGWIQAAILPDSLLSEPHAFYAISGVLTAVPEPGAFSLLTLIVPAILRWRRRYGVLAGRLTRA